MGAMDELGIADNTVVIIMGDNGHFTKYSPQSGYTPMVFRGGKVSTTEGGVRVDAFVRWPGMIEADSVVGDMVHVTDLFMTIARLAGAVDEVPTDRIIDGIDQTALLLEGETNGRRDYVFLYNINTLEAVVKEQYKLTIPGGKIENAILADFYDLYRDPQERYPVSTEIGAGRSSCAWFNAICNAKPNSRTKAPRQVCLMRESRTLGQKPGPRLTSFCS
jgi:arylsulfatase